MVSNNLSIGESFIGLTCAWFGASNLSGKDGRFLVDASRAHFGAGQNLATSLGHLPFDHTDPCFEPRHGDLHVPPSQKHGGDRADDPDELPPGEVNLGVGHLGDPEGCRETQPSTCPSVLQRLTLATWPEVATFDAALAVLPNPATSASMIAISPMNSQHS